MSTVDCDVAILRAQQDWDLSQVRHVLVPIGGRGTHDEMRARFLGSLCRTGQREITFLRVLPEHASWKARDKAQRELTRIAQDKVPGHSSVETILSDSIADEVTQRAAKSDLVILGLQRFSRGRKTFGDLSRQIARHATCAIIMLSQRG